MATTKATSKSSARTDVKIGISDSSHELNFECSNTQAEVIAKVNEAIKSSSILSLSDSKGREILVPFNRSVTLKLVSLPIATLVLLINKASELN
jgi:hypothetical protein